MLLQWKSTAHRLGRTFQFSDTLVRANNIFGMKQITVFSSKECIAFWVGYHYAQIKLIYPETAKSHCHKRRCKYSYTLSYPQKPNHSNYRKKYAPNPPSLVPNPSRTLRVPPIHKRILRFPLLNRGLAARNPRCIISSLTTPISPLKPPLDSHHRTNDPHQHRRTPRQSHEYPRPWIWTWKSIRMIQIQDAMGDYR
jgi:hypothetical protein